MRSKEGGKEHKMDKKELAEFLFKARGKTNAKAGGQVKPQIEGTEQAEYAEGDWLYRDVYFNGKSSFMGMDVVYFQGKPVWGSSYHGSFRDITEEKLDKILRQAIADHPGINSWMKVEEAVYGEYKYENIPNSEGQTIDEVSGVERIIKNEEIIYSLYYRGSFLNK